MIAVKSFQSALGERLFKVELEADEQLGVILTLLRNHRLTTNRLCRPAPLPRMRELLLT